MTWHRSILTRLQLVHSAPMQHCKLLTGWLISCVSCHTGQNTDLSSESAHHRASLGAIYQSFVKKRCYGSPKTLMDPASSRSLSPESSALLLKQTLGKTTSGHEQSILSQNYNNFLQTMTKVETQCKNIASPWTLTSSSAIFRGSPMT
jgi:hypothetical protein